MRKGKGQGRDAEGQGHWWAWQGVSQDLCDFFTWGSAHRRGLFRDGTPWSERKLGKGESLSVCVCVRVRGCVHARAQGRMPHSVLPHLYPPPWLPRSLSIGGNHLVPHSRYPPSRSYHCPLPGRDHPVLRPRPSPQNPAVNPRYPAGPITHFAAGTHQRAADSRTSPTPPAPALEGKELPSHILARELQSLCVW